MSSESTALDIRRMLGDNPSEKESPTTFGSAGRSNSLDLSPRAIEQFRAEFRRDSSPKARAARIIVEVVDQTTGREVVFPLIFGPQGIQVKDCPSRICSEHMEAIREAYHIPNDIEIRAAECDEMIDWVIDG